MFELKVLEQIFSITVDPILEGLCLQDNQHRNPKMIVKMTEKTCSDHTCICMQAAFSMWLSKVA